MAKRYVRVRADQQQIYYGFLQANRSVSVLDAPPWLGGQPTNIELAVDTYQFLAPCAPSKIIAVGRNYPKHAQEMETALPQEPLLFLKPTTTAIATRQPILYPQQSQRIDYEGELAIVIGKRSSNLNQKEAASSIWGYTIANDVTARDLQRKDSQWTRAKGFDTFCPLGPWIVRELAADAVIQTFINDEENPRQSSPVFEMVFTPEVLVSYISQIMTLLPGDVILCGTPEGIGAMVAGDVVTIKIEGIGEISNPVISGPRIVAYS